MVDDAVFWCGESFLRVGVRRFALCADVPAGDQPHLSAIMPREDGAPGNKEYSAFHCEKAKSFTLTKV